MKIFKQAAMAAAVAGAALAMANVAEAKGGCVMAGGEATMVTQDLAKFMAEAALKNSIAAHNWTARGPVSMKCDGGTVGLQHCLARRRACG
jgi:hypothetical protein